MTLPQREKEPYSKRLWLAPERSAMPKEFIRLSPWEMEYLFMIARRARCGIVEIGRLNGGSTFVMACAASPDVRIYSIDIQPQDDGLLRRLFDDNGIGKNVELIVGDSQRGAYPQIGEIDLLFIDGDHTFEGCRRDLNNWYGRLVVNGHLLLHDVYMGRYGIQDAVADFMNDHPELQVIKSPFIGAHHWHYPAGSMAHLIRRVVR